MNIAPETFMDFSATAQKGMVGVPAISLLAGHVLPLESVKALVAASTDTEFHGDQSYYLITMVRETYEASLFRTLFSSRLPRLTKITLMDGDGDFCTVLMNAEKALETLIDVSFAPHHES